MRVTLYKKNIKIFLMLIPICILGYTLLSNAQEHLRFYLLDKNDQEVDRDSVSNVSIIQKGTKFDLKKTGHNFFLLPTRIDTGSVCCIVIITNEYIDSIFTNASNLFGGAITLETRKNHVVYRMWKKYFVINANFGDIISTILFCKNYGKKNHKRILSAYY